MTRSWRSTPWGRASCGLGNLIGRLLESIPEVPSAGQVLVEMIFDLRPAVNRQRRPPWRGSPSSAGRSRGPCRMPSPGPWCPDLAIEIVSPSNTHVQTKQKLREYFAAGVRGVWLVSPATGEVEDYDAPTSVRILEAGQLLDLSTLWPGVSIEVKRLLGTPST